MKRQTGLNLIAKTLKKTKRLSPEQQAEAVMKILEQKQLISPPETVVEMVIQDGVTTPVYGMEWSKTQKELNQQPLRYISFKKTS